MRLRQRLADPAQLGGRAPELELGPLHRYFVAAKRAEFELGGATAQLRRIGEALAQAH